MSENRDLIPSAGPTVIRVKHLKVISPEYDMDQFGRTIKVFADASMPFEMIANTGQSLGYQVQRGEIDILLKEPDIKKIGEVMEYQGKIVAWQNRGEMVSTTPRLVGVAGATGKEVVLTQNVTVKESAQAVIEVIEGIEVEEKKQDKLENNPYLKAA